jgi:hypothetical protein
MAFLKVAFVDRGHAFGAGRGSHEYQADQNQQQEMAVGRIPNIIDIDSIDDEALTDTSRQQVDPTQ